MTAPVELTWDMNPPRVPSLDDLGGATVENDAVFPPDRRRMLYAEQVNQWAMQEARLAQLSPFARFQIEYSGGSPALVAFRAMRTNLTTSDIVVTHAGTGIVEITWSLLDGLGNPVQVFPAPTMAPMAYLISDVAACAPYAENIVDGVRVKMRDQTGALADLNFVVVLY